MLKHQFKNTNQRLVTTHQTLAYPRKKEINKKRTHRGPKLIEAQVLLWVDGLLAGVRVAPLVDHGAADRVRCVLQNVIIAISFTYEETIGNYV